jgi:gas vesicle protein
MGYLRGLTHGALLGAALGFLYAPDSGTAMRQRVARLLGQAEDMMATDASGAPAAPTRRRTSTESRARRP